MSELKMKSLIVYDTTSGNTRKIAEVIADTLKDSGIQTDLFYLKDLKKFDGKEYNLLALGSPTRFGTMSFAMKSFLGKVKSEEWTSKSFIAFDTENPENVEKSQTQNKNWSAAEKIAEILREKKMNQLMPVLKALVIGVWKGSLVEGEVEKTRNFALELASKFKEVAIMETEKNIGVNTMKEGVE